MMLPGAIHARPETLRCRKTLGGGSKTGEVTVLILVLAVEISPLLTKLAIPSKIPWREAVPQNLLGKTLLISDYLYSNHLPKSL